MEAKEEFLEIFYDKVERDGAEKLVEWLERSDFFTAPASTKKHSAYKGGLCEHSIKVYKRFIKLLRAEYGDDFSSAISEEGAAIVALLHDVCKVNFYKEDFRNVKDDNGNWYKKPVYVVEDTLPYGHGEKSVYIISGFMKLTREEAMAINWHMGGFDARCAGGSFALYQAFCKYPVAILLHVADMLTSYLDESRE